MELYAEGCYIGDADQFNSWWDQKVSLLAGQSLKITAASGGRAFSRTVVMASAWTGSAVGARHLPFGVRKENFEGPGSFVFDPDALETDCRNSPMARLLP